MKTDYIIQQTRRTWKKLTFLAFLFFFLVLACSRETEHVKVPEELGYSQGGIIAEFNTDSLTNRQFDDTYFYVFNADQKMVADKYYPGQQVLATDMTLIAGGTYTVVAVLNVGKQFSTAMEAKVGTALSEIAMDKLLGYVREVEKDYPDMLTGLESVTVVNAEVMRAKILLMEGAGAIPQTACRVMATITLPDAGFADYQQARSKATESHNLRGVAEFCRKGTTDVAIRTKALLTPTETVGVYTMEVEVAQGEYDLILWVDYTAVGSTDDLWYETKSLQAIRILAADKQYAAGSTREVFYGTGRVEATGATAAVNITTDRPQAKYILIANDLKRYRELLAANPDKYLPLDQITLTVHYEGFLPDGFNVFTGKPNSSEAGYRYTCGTPTVSNEDTETRIAGDYVFVNGTESLVVISVVVAGPDGKVISRVQGITVNYKRGMVTILRGDFLTAGVINPGINIDTDWEGNYDMEF